MKRGHPWIFAESVREQNREGTTGELAVVFDRNDEFLAVGLYDRDSPIRIRVLHTGGSTPINKEWFRARLSGALEKRKGILDERTNAARLIHGESDQFPGLVLDRYAGTLVLKLYSAIWFPWLDDLVELFKELPPTERLVLRLSRNIQAAAATLRLQDGQLLFGPPVTKPVEFLETGLRFEADVVHGQKTGFFLDQRENRRFVESLAPGKNVLNAFSFSGGFSLYAARGKARVVTDVDISAHALESSRRNFALNANETRATRHELIQADVFDWLRDAPRRKYDLVIIDPPSLAKRESDRPVALKAYAALATAGMRVASEPGTVVCCSCSAHVRPEEFFQSVIEAAQRTGASFQIMRQTNEPADHPAAFPEARYLKAIYLALKSRR